jgi:hypothetical protein
VWNYLAEWQKHSLWDLVHAEGIGYRGIMGEIDKSSEDKKKGLASSITTLDSYISGG